MHRNFLGGGSVEEVSVAGLDTGKFSLAGGEEGFSGVIFFSVVFFAAFLVSFSSSKGGVSGQISTTLGVSLFFSSLADEGLGKEEGCSLSKVIAGEQARGGAISAVKKLLGFIFLFLTQVGFMVAKKANKFICGEFFSDDAVFTI